jgi:hypothetical protein
MSKQKCNERCEVYSRSCLRLLSPGGELEQGKEGRIQRAQAL